MNVLLDNEVADTIKLFSMVSAHEEHLTMHNTRSTCCMTFVRTTCCMIITMPICDHDQHLDNAWLPGHGLNMLINIQTSKELAEMDINKMMINGLSTMNDKHTQS